MPDKLPDKKIVKALECCASGEVEECKNCPYVEGYPYCDGPMERDVLDLINRLQEKDKTRHKVFETKCEELEIAKAENDKLCVEIDELIVAKDLLFDEAEALIKKAKAEAYKECMEQLDAEIESSDKYIREYDDSELQKAYNQGLRNALRALKELVGD